MVQEVLGSYCHIRVGIILEGVHLLMEPKIPNKEQVSKLADGLIAKVEKNLETVKELKKRRGSIRNKCNN